MNTSNKKSPSQTHSERRESTQKNVIESASRLFGAQGYDHTSIDQISKDAGLTEGAIYHHYGNKIKLFTAVTEYQEAQLTQKFAASMNTQNATALMEFWDVFLLCCKDEGFVQILLVDAPHILGRDRWFQTSVLKQFESTMFEPELSKLMSLSEMDKVLLFHMLVAAIAEAALMVAKNPDYDASHLLERLIDMISNS